MDTQHTQQIAEVVTRTPGPGAAAMGDITFADPTDQLWNALTTRNTQAIVDQLRSVDLRPLFERCTDCGEVTSRCACDSDESDLDDVYESDEAFARAVGQSTRGEI